MSRLALAARRAASRFAASRRRGKVRGARQVWFLIALRWRQRRTRPEKERAHRSAAPAAATALWLAHVHLHFAATANERRRRGEARPFAPAAAIREMPRLLVSRHSTTVRASTLAMQWRRPAASPHVFHAGRAAAPKADFPVTTTIGRMPRLPMLFRIARPAVHHRQHSIFEKRVSTSERTERVERRAVLSSRELLIFRRRAASKAAGSRSHTNEPSLAWLTRRAELLWRNAPVPRTDVAIETSDPGASSPRPAARAAAVPEMPPEIATRPARAALQMKDFDPALLDRLTDDVIRRVERRVRIERERRGV
jgi:hypothetical protein